MWVPACLRMSGTTGLSGKRCRSLLANVKIKFDRSAVISRLEASKNLIIRPWRHTWRIMGFVK
jgi:hypothetical protein